MNQRIMLGTKRIEIICHNVNLFVLICHVSKSVIVYLLFSGSSLSSLLFLLSIAAQLFAFIFVLSCLTRSVDIFYLLSDHVRVGVISIRVELVAAGSIFSTRFS